MLVCEIAVFFFSIESENTHITCHISSDQNRCSSAESHGCFGHSFLILVLVLNDGNGIQHVLLFQIPE